MGDEFKRTLTRSELHDLVWSTPIQKLAERYGLSDRGFSKICERHLVPVPPRGYWAKLEAGQPVKRTSLRPVENTSLETVHIGTRIPVQSSDYLASVLASAKGEVTPSKPKKESRAEVSSLSKPAAAPTKLHDEIKPFLNELRLLKPDRDGFIHLRYVKLPPETIDRFGRFISQIIEGLQPYGFKLIDDKKTRLGFSKHGHTIDFGIEAPRKRVPSGPDSWGAFDYLHVGRLDFTIYGWAKDVRKNWKDTDGRKIEEALPQIVDSFLINHAIGMEREAEEAIKAARRAHMARRRELVTLRAKREEDRREFLDWLASARREIIELRSTISLIPPAGGNTADYDRMILWANRRLSDLEVLTTVESIQAALMDRKLYPDPDELHDPEGDPPPKLNYWDD